VTVVTKTGAGWYCSDGNMNMICWYSTVKPVGVFAELSTKWWATKLWSCPIRYGFIKNGYYSLMITFWYTVGVLIWWHCCCVLALLLLMFEELTRDGDGGNQWRVIPEDTRTGNQAMTLVILEVVTSCYDDILACEQWLFLKWWCGLLWWKYDRC